MCGHVLNIDIGGSNKIFPSGNLGILVQSIEQKISLRLSWSLQCSNYSQMARRHLGNYVDDHPGRLPRGAVTT
jgi:hypothetical protein